MLHARRWPGLRSGRRRGCRNAGTASPYPDRTVPACGGWRGGPRRAARRPHRRRAPAWASGGNGARYVALGRRMRRMTSGTSTSECSGCLFLSCAASGKNPGERRNREEGRGAGAFLGDTDDRLRAWHGRARPRPAGAGRRSAAYGRVQAPEQCCRCPDRVKKRAGRGKRKGKRAEESVPADRADAGSARPGIQCCGFRTDQDASGRSARRSGRVRQACRPRARNRGSGSKALGMISPVG